MSTPDHTPNVFESRQQNLQYFRDAGLDPFPATFAVSHQAAELHDTYKDLTDGTVTGDVVQVAGRIMAARNTCMFIDLKDGSDKIQVFCHKQDLDDAMLERLKHLDLGDIIGVSGYIRRTPRGELTVNAKAVTLLTKAMRPLPEKYHGLADVETRYRQRYLDLITNDDSRAVFMKRSLIIAYIRSALMQQGFLDVETPMLHPIPGGAVAKPFVTHHNTLDMELYLRIAPELYLKRLIIGGLDRVFEIGRCFRNEGISIKHNPEFTSVEIYQAYADYTDMMALTENLVMGAAKAISGDGSAKVTFDGQEIDFTAPWQRKSMVDLVREATGIDFLQNTDPDQAIAVARNNGLQVPDGANWGQVVEIAFEEKVEKTLIQPTHVTDIPRDISPLAKGHKTIPQLTERFESYANGWEIANAFSELNDPAEQLARFQDQAAARDAGDEEAHVVDSDFVLALEHGMPPTGGLGIGIDRLVMLLTDSPSIRDVIAFPTMRPVHD